MSALAEEMTADYCGNLPAMGVDTVDHFPKATENIHEIIDFTQSSDRTRLRLRVRRGRVFRCRQRPEYGKLANRSG